MSSVSKRTGKKFTGRFASLAVKIGLATPSGEELTSEQLKAKQDEIDAKEAAAKAKKGTQ